MEPTRHLMRMKLTCDGCGETRTFTGKDAEAVIRAIDEAQWHDYPDEEDPSRIRARCHPCYEEWLGEED